MSEQRDGDMIFGYERQQQKACVLDNLCRAFAGYRHLDGEIEIAVYDEGWCGRRPTVL